MRTGLVYCALGLCAVGPGCSLPVLATRNVVLEIRDAVEDCQEGFQARRQARAAWDQVSSPAYAEGFREGYATYLRKGTASQFASLAPARYRREGVRTPPEVQAEEEWLTGYRHGVSAAEGNDPRAQPAARGAAPATDFGTLQYPQPAPASGVQLRRPEPVLPFPRQVVPKLKPERD